jgi:hypothetical protein
LHDGKYHLAGSNNAKADYIKYLYEHPIGVDRGTVVGRTAVERRVVHIPDGLADPEYTAHEYARTGKHRSMLGVPLLRDGVPVGVISLLRTSVKPYTDKQIELVTTFDDQAVIAIENVRLFDEVQTRTRDLSESLQQQTATAEVLKVISSSPGDLEPVFSAMLENASAYARPNSVCCSVMKTVHFILQRLQWAFRRCLPTSTSSVACFSRRPDHLLIASCKSGVPSIPPTRRQNKSRLAGQTWWRAVSCRSTDAEGEQTDWCDRHLPSGSSPIHRKAD